MADGKEYDVVQQELTAKRIAEDPELAEWVKKWKSRRFRYPRKANPSNRKTRLTAPSPGEKSSPMRLLSCKRKARQNMPSFTPKDSTNSLQSWQYYPFFFGENRGGLTPTTKPVD